MVLLAIIWIHVFSFSNTMKEYLLKTIIYKKNNGIIDRIETFLR